MNSSRFYVILGKGRGITYFGSPLTFSVTLDGQRRYDSSLFLRAHSVFLLFRYTYSHLKHGEGNLQIIVQSVDRFGDLLDLIRFIR